MGIVPIQKTNHSLMLKETILFATLAVMGAAICALGLALIIFAHNHGRTYVFLILGAGGFIGGLSAMIVRGQKIRVAIDYGLIAIGIVGMFVGLNYFSGEYGTEPNLVHEYLVIALNVSAILVGLIAELVMLSKTGFVGFSSVIMVGVIGSIGLAALLVGTMCLAVLDYPVNGFFLLTSGAVCIIGGIVWVLFVQERASTIRG